MTNKKNQKNTTTTTLLQRATKAAYVATRTIYRKNPTQEITTLYRGLQFLCSKVSQGDDALIQYMDATASGQSTTDTLSDAMDLVQVAATALLEYDAAAAAQSSDDCLCDCLCHANGNNIEVCTCHSIAPDFVAAIKAVNKYIKAQSSTRGRKAIISKTLLPHGDIDVYKDGEHIATEAAQEEYTYTSGYSIQHVELSAQLPAPLQGQWDICDDIEEQTAMIEATEAIATNPRDVQIFNLLVQGYTQAEIMQEMGIASKSIVSTALSRICHKIAQNPYFADSPTVQAYIKKQAAKTAK